VKAWDTLSQEQKDLEDLKMATYAGVVDHLDRGVGRILDKLQQMGVVENTLVMFLSDNGASPFDRARDTQFMPWDSRSHWTYHAAWANACNTPFRLYKRNQHEGGDHTPFIARWPGVIRQGGQMTEQVGHILDVMATCVEVSGATYPSSFGGRQVKPLRGMSLSPAFRGEPTQPREGLFYAYDGNRAVRMAQWKLVAEESERWELYDMDADRTELHDLAAAQTDRVKAMALKWDAWAKEVNVTPEQEGKTKKEKKKGKKGSDDE
jgi:arylsulfatase